MEIPDELLEKVDGALARAMRHAASMAGTAGLLGRALESIVKGLSEDLEDLDYRGIQELAGARKMLRPEPDHRPSAGPEAGGGAPKDTP